jgi:hypothetical protein
MNAPRIRCRSIADTDLAAVAELLTRGFAGRPRAYWLRGLRRQQERPSPEGYPRYGYVLESDGAIVGALLLLYSVKTEGSETAICCNESSWYVEPAFRSHASLLSTMAHKHKHVTYINVTPARGTWPILEAQGFRRYCAGLFFSAPALSRRSPGDSLEVIGPSTPRADDISEADFDLLNGHARYGCLSLVCRSASGEVRPLVLMPFRMRRGRLGLPAMQLIYCRGVADFVRYAGVVGRFLLRRGWPVVILDSNGPIPGLTGIYSEARGRKYFKGPHPPRLADLSETELVLFGP